MPRILDLSPDTYVRHRTHQPGRVWAETNCYTDVVLELLHGMGHEPLAALAFTLSVDFDVDQWTFFKFHPADIERLYGVSLHELAPWRPLARHVEDHVAAGRFILVELDSFFLPDTAGTAYGREHVKSTVAVNQIDREQRTLEYFHNQGYHALSGDDFTAIFQEDGLVHERMLPPYIEFVRAIPGAVALDGAARVEASLAALTREVRRRPPRNPFRAFSEQLQADLEWLMKGALDDFHAYSFATLRQYGANFELAATYLTWLGEQGVDGLEEAAAALGTIATETKALQPKLARAVMRKRAFDPAPLLRHAELWEAAQGALTRRLG